MKNGIYPEGYAVTRKKTNADRIRNMTDEELAKFLTTFNNTFGEEYEGESSCLDWLSAESEEQHGEINKDKCGGRIFTTKAVEFNS